MTIRAKRAKALLILDKDADWSMGGMVDESLSPDGESYLESLSVFFSGDLRAWFKQRIGRYRVYSEMAKKMPATSEELRLVSEAQRYLLEVRQRLKNLPPAADAYINAACWHRHKRLFHGTDGFLSDLNALAREADTLLAITEQELGRYPVNKGSKPKQARDSLLSDTAAYLLEHSCKPITKRKAAELARDLLVATDVEAPKETVEIERLIRRERGGRNSL